MAKVDEMLGHLDDLEARKQLVLADHETAKRRLIPADILRELEDLEEQHQSTLEEIDEQIKAAKEALKPVALEHGKKLDGRYFQIQIRRGPDKWDGRGLEAWFAANDLEALERFRTKGKPTVAFVSLVEKKEA